MINLTPIDKRIQKRLFEKMRVLGRETSTNINESSQGGLTHKDIATRSTFLRMTSNQPYPVILMGGKLKRDGSMHAGYNDIYGSRTYFADDPKMQQGAADLYNVRNGDVSQAMENIIDTGQSIKTLHNKGKRPIPGVKGVDVTFKGGVRALREATINWTCWDFKELDFLMPHFLAHGKTVMVEWGWVYNTDTLQKLPPFIKTSPETNLKYISADVYSNYRKEIFDADGDFDMMIGIIKNFEFTTREDGGFDCQTILTSVGASILENPQTNDVALDPNITYNLSINENDKETAEKITKAVGKDGTKDSQRGDTDSLVTLNTSVSLKLLIKEIDRYLLTDLVKGDDAKDSQASEGEALLSKSSDYGSFAWKPNRYVMGFPGVASSPIKTLKSGLSDNYQANAIRNLLGGSTVGGVKPQLWVRWGWFEDNILSKFLSVTSKPDDKSNDPPTNLVITEFRSIERKLNQDKDDSKKYESVRIKNNRELQTTNINHYILPGQFYPVKPTSFDVDGEVETLRGDSSYLRKLAKIVNEPKNFSKFATKSDKIEVVREVYEEEITKDLPGKKFDKKKLTKKDDEIREVDIPGKHGYLRNMLINTDLIKQAFGVNEADEFTVESINIIETMESLFSLLNQELNFWNYKITVDGVETHRAKIVDEQVTNFDFDKPTNIQKSMIVGDDIRTLDNNDEGVFFFPVWRSDTIVKRQNITAKIPDAMQLAVMYGSNMDQLKDFANPGGQFAEKEGVLVGGLFNKHQDVHKGGLDIAIRNENTKNLGVTHGIKEDGEPIDDASQSLNSDLNAGDDILQFLIDNSEILEETFETKLKQINKDLDISSQTQDAFLLEFNDAVPPPFVRSLELSQLKTLLQFEKRRESALGYNQGELTKLMGSLFYKTGEMKPQFKRSVSYLTTQHGINKQANTPLLIPLELELDIDGIGGIYPGNSFHSSYVPARYQNNTVFQIFDVNHRLDSSGWTVTLTGKMRATMNNIFEGFRKLEELQGEQFKNYVNKAINTENLTQRTIEWNIKYEEYLRTTERTLRGIDREKARAKFMEENPRPE